MNLTAEERKERKVGQAACLSSNLQMVVEIRTAALPNRLLPHRSVLDDRQDACPTLGASPLPTARVASPA